MPKTLSPHRTQPPRRLRDIGRGLGAAVLLLALIAGIPALLGGTIGWPLPHSLPSLAELRSTLSSTKIPDQTILKGIAVCAWAYWLHLVWCLAVETVAAVRGHLPRRVLLGGVNQAIASRLVAAILLLGPTSMTLRPLAVAAIAAQSPAVVREIPPTSPSTTTTGTPVARWGLDASRTPPSVEATEGPEHSDTAAIIAPADPPGQRQPAAQRTYTVKRGDTLWGVAERELGDPLRYSELERLNLGRVQPDGSRLEDPDLILPGWELVLPPVVGSATRPVPSPQPGGSSSAAPPVASAPTPPSNAAPATTTTRAPTATTAPPTTEAPTPTASAPTSAPPATTPPAEQPSRPTVTLPVLIAALSIGLFAAGLLAVLARLRRIQQRHLSRGRRIRLPLGRTADVELALRIAAEPESAVFVDLALRTLAAGIRHDALPVPTIDAVLLTDTAIEMLLATPASPAPQPFVSTDDGRRWTLPRDTPLEALNQAAHDTVPPLPSLITIGQTITDPIGRLLVNLEAGRLVAAHGDPADTTALLNAIAVELATASWTGFLELVLVGFGAEFQALERVQVAATLEAILPRLERRAAEAATLLDELGCGSALEGRITGAAADSLVPTVVLCATPPQPAALNQLAALATAPRPAPLAAMIVGDAPAAPWRIRLAGDVYKAHLDPLDIEIRPQRLGPDECAAIGELLRIAADTSGVPAEAPPYDQLQRPPAPTRRLAAVPDPEAAQAPGAAAAEPAGPTTTAHRTSTVEVRVLGKTELHGVPKIERAKAVEAVVYLAMHPGGVDGERIWEALWPDKPINRGTFHTTISAARSGLGEASDGTLYLRNPHEGIYRLHPALQLDWATFQTLVEQAHQPGADAAPLLRQALEFVRGLPFDSTVPRSYAWAVVHRTEIETAVAEAAQDLGELCLDASDPAGANWAARHGLLSSPYDERLYRVLMRAAHAVGNPAGVDTILRELIHVLDVDDDPVDELHPLTVDLYRQLRPRRSIHA